MAFDIHETPLQRKMGEALHAASIYFETPITRARVMAKSKAKEHCRPRQWCMAYLYWRYPELSMPRVARMFSLKDHTTVLHAVRKARVYFPDAVFCQPEKEADDAA